MIGCGTCTIRRGKVRIYVYQIDDSSYGAGFIEAVCARRGRIVERWSVDTEQQIRFLKRHGTGFHGAYDQVLKLAHRAERCMDESDEEFSDRREAILLELACLPFMKRLMTGIRVIFGRYQER